MYKTAAIEISNEVWDKYKQTNSIHIRNKILTAYLYIVTVNVKRMSALYQNKDDFEDIVNQGVIALIDCIERYDCQRGVQFDSFASIRIRGSIIDYIRKQDWVPRDIRKKSIDIKNAYADLQTASGEPPTDQEVADHIGINMEQFNKITAQSYSFSILSYEKLLQEQTYSFYEPASTVKNPEQMVQEAEIKKIIALSIDKLSEKERLIVSLYYYEELKQKEIAVILGITSSRVSQIHAKALIKMKKILNDYING